MARHFRILTASLCALVLAGCHQAPPKVDAGRPGAVTVTSPVLAPGGPVPTRFTCDGADVSPPLSWQVAAGTVGTAEPRAWALVVDDPDAPGGTYVHWVVLDIPVGTRSVSEGATPTGGVTAKNSAGRAAYAGPCPPSGRHRYRFTVFGLSAPTGLPQGTGLDAALKAIDAKATVRGTLVTTYRRSSG